MAAALLCGLVVGAAEYALLAEEPRDLEAAGRKPGVILDFGEGVPIAQTFTMTRDGLEALGVKLWTNRPAVLWVTCELLQRVDASARVYEPIYRWTTRIGTDAGAQWHTIRFAPIESSANHVYQVRLWLRRADVPHRAAPAGETERFRAGLMAWSDNPLRFATMMVDGQERWDDLAFWARGAGRTRYARLQMTVAPDLPPLLRHSSIQLVALVVFNLALVSVVYGLLLRVESPVHSSERTETSISSAERGQVWSRVRWIRLVAATVTTAGLCGALVWAVGRDREHLALDLIDDLDTAVMESPGGLHGAFDLVEELINGRRLRAIFAHPISKITWHVDVPDNAALRTDLALVQGIWERPGDGVAFRIGVAVGPAYHELCSVYVNPMGRLTDRAWIPVDANLSAYAGQRVALIFETLPGPAGDASYDWALWGQPRIVLSRTHGQ